ncbi:MAG: hypothetical protein JWL82_343 [Parcubacteria group bacterium]|nr:hypothetical protein [Parcubacteria group bacterium]
MDTQNIQWTIKGLSPEIVEKTRRVAKERGFKLNRFVERALECAIQDEENGGRSRTEQLQVAIEQFNAATRQLEQVAEKLMVDDALLGRTLARALVKNL